MITLTYVLHDVYLLWFSTHRISQRLQNFRYVTPDAPREIVMPQALATASNALFANTLVRYRGSVTPSIPNRLSHYFTIVALDKVAIVSLLFAMIGQLFDKFDVNLLMRTSWHGTSRIGDNSNNNSDRDSDYETFPPGQSSTVFAKLGYMHDTLIVYPC